MQCPNCGATIPDGSIRCPYCHSEVPGAERIATRGATPSRAAVFEAIRRSPEFKQAESAERQAKLPAYSSVQRAIPMVFAVVFIAASLVILAGFLAVGGGIGFGLGGRGGGALFGLCAAIVPLGFVVIGVLMLIHFRNKMQEFDRAPTLTRPAIVAGKRTQVSGGSGDSSATTHYHITCEFEDGTRTEFEPIEQGLYAQLSENDAGVAFTRASVLLAFDRVVV